MDSTTCCSVRDEKNKCQCYWNRDRDPNCDLVVKTNVPVRRKREFTPDEQKDADYWFKRRRNNEAARRSRERRRTEERLLEARTTQLIRENQTLRAALSAFNYHTVDGAVGKNQDLSANSYLGSWAGFPASVPRTSPKSLSRVLSSGCNFESAYTSDIESFSAGSYMGPTQDTTHPRDKYVSGHLGIHLHNKYGADALVHPGVNSHYNPDQFTPRDQGHHYTHMISKSEHQGKLAGAASQSTYVDKEAFLRSDLEFHKDGVKDHVSDGVKWCRWCKRSCFTPLQTCRTHVVLDEPGAKETPIIKDKELNKTVIEAERISVLPLLPHKLRYKVKKKQNGEDLLS